MIPSHSFVPSLEALESRTLFAAGVLDTTFGINGVTFFSPRDPNAAVHDIATLPDGRSIVVGGSQADGTLGVTRLLSNGKSDPSFGFSGARRATSAPTPKCSPSQSKAI